jgi:hypothetical protein
MDLDRYRVADHKILKVRSLRREGNDAVGSFRSWERGLLALARQRMHLVPGKRIDVTNVPSSQDRLVGVKGSFVCEPASES